jgi:hypothetical protein
VRLRRRIGESAAYLSSLIVASILVEEGGVEFLLAEGLDFCCGNFHLAKIRKRGDGGEAPRDNTPNVFDSDCFGFAGGSTFS